LDATRANQAVRRAELMGWGYRKIYHKKVIPHHHPGYHKKVIVHHHYHHPLLPWGHHWTHSSHPVVSAHHGHGVSVTLPVILLGLLLALLLASARPTSE